MTYGTKEELITELAVARLKFKQIKRAAIFTPITLLVVAISCMAIILNSSGFLNFLIIPIACFLLVQFYAMKIVEISKYDVDRAEMTLRYAD